MTPRSPIGALASGAVAALIAAAVLLLLGQNALEALSRDILIDTDGYLHALRVKMMLSGEEPTFIARDNAPHGFFMHWSGLYDALVHAIARLALAIDPALLPYALGMSSALTLALLCGVSVWALAPATTTRSLIFAALLFLCAYGLYGYGQIGRNDHHVFSLLPVAVAFGALLRIREGASAPQWGAVAGAACGLALWITPETLPATLLCLGLLVALRLDGAPARAAAFAIPMLTVLGIGLLADPPVPEPLAPEIDRHSIVFLALGAVLCAAAIAFDLAAARLASTTGKAVLAAVLGTGALAGWLAAFPEVLAGPDTLLGPDLTRLWWDQIRELKPVSSAREFMSFAALGAAGALAALHRARKERTLFWAVAALGAIAFCAMTLVHVRFSPASNLIGILLLGLSAGHANLFSDAEPRPFARVAAVVLAAPLLSLLLLVAASLAETAPADPALEPKRCTISAVAAALEALPEKRATILTTTGEAPEILYRTRHATIAGPYQRNVDGLRDVYAFLLAEDDAVAAAVAARRDVDYVLLCDRPPPEPYRAFSPNGLLMRVVDDAVPGWLMPVPWPQGTETDLLLFRVDQDALPSGAPR